MFSTKFCSSISMGQMILCPSLFGVQTWVVYLKTNISNKQLTFSYSNYWLARLSLLFWPCHGFIARKTLGLLSKKTVICIQSAFCGYLSLDRPKTLPLRLMALAFKFEPWKLKAGVLYKCCSGFFENMLCRFDVNSNIFAGYDWMFKK